METGNGEAMTPRPLTLWQLQEIARTAPLLCAINQVVAVIDQLLRAEAYWRERAERLAVALVMYDDKVRDVQNFYGDPGCYAHNALQTAQLVHGDTVAEARAALAEEPKP